MSKNSSKITPGHCLFPFEVPGNNSKTCTVTSSIEWKSTFGSYFAASWLFIVCLYACFMFSFGLSTIRKKFKHFQNYPCYLEESLLYQNPTQQKSPKQQHQQKHQKQQNHQLIPQQQESHQQRQDKQHTKQCYDNILDQKNHQQQQFHQHQQQQQNRQQTCSWQTISNHPFMPMIICLLHSSLSVVIDSYVFYRTESGKLLDGFITCNNLMEEAMFIFIVAGCINLALIGWILTRVDSKDAMSKIKEIVFILQFLFEDSPTVFLHYFYLEKYSHKGKILWCVLIKTIFLILLSVRLIRDIWKCRKTYFLSPRNLYFDTSNGEFGSCSRIDKKTLPIDDTDRTKMTNIESQSQRWKVLTLIICLTIMFTHVIHLICTVYHYITSVRSLHKIDWFSCLAVFEGNVVQVPLTKNCLNFLDVLLLAIIIVDMLLITIFLPAFGLSVN